MQAILAEEYPGAFVSLSSEVLPQLREPERTMATALNRPHAPGEPVCGRAARRLDAMGVKAPLLNMKSDGGVTS
jgi:N-methylhydantoinase A